MTTRNLSPVSIKDDHSEFMAVFPEIVRALTDAPAYQTNVPQVMERYVKVLEYCVPDGKHISAIILIDTYKLLQDADELTAENMHMVYVMGWCLELLETHFMILDDIMDHSETRRGKPCWYKNDGIGLSGINDAILVMEGIYTILKRYFSGKSCYLPIIELFHEATIKSLMGQTLDMMSRGNGKSDLRLFTMEKYNAIIKYKFGPVSQYPVLLAMCMAGKYDTERYRQAELILGEIGKLYVIQDDALDYFGDGNITRKASFDICEGKCTWFIVMALQKATPKQKEILEANYGRPEPEAVQAVRSVYDDLSLREAFRAYEEENYNLIRTRIQQISNDMLHDVFFKILGKIYKRSS